MKKAALYGILISAGLLSSGLAAADTRYEQGRVLSAVPIYESVRVPTEREVCWDEEVRYRRSHSPTPALLGGVLGGAVGRQFGGGRGKDALTVVGAIVGASVGNDIARQRSDEYNQVETRCRIAQEYYEEERITGYRVRYEYDGQVYSTRTDRDPGQYIDLRVSVVPVSP